MPAARLDEYGEWISNLRDLPELDGRDMLIWVDILAGKPELVGRLPDGVTVCEWGYEDWHPFDARTRSLADAGRPFWVCPGTSSWLTVLGRVTNMIGDCRNAAEAARAHGSAGLLNTDWGDLGHLQYLPVSEPGFAYGAAVSWCLDTNRDLDLAAALDAHAFDDPAGKLGAALLALGDAYLGVVPKMWNMSVLTMHLYWPQLQLGRTFSDGLSIDDLLGVEQGLADAVDRLGRATPARSDGALVLDELRAGAALVSLMCRDARLRLEGDGWLSSIPAAQRQELADELDGLIAEHRRLWLARNRPGGLEDSVGWLAHLRDCYRTGAADRTWGGW